MVVHHVGNKSKGDGVNFSEKTISLDGIEEDLKRLIIKSFDLSDLYHFYYEVNVELNPVFSFVKTIFNDENAFIANSKHIAKILYECSGHPKVKEGEVSVILLEDCEIGGNVYPAVAILKSESPQELLELSSSGGNITAKKAKGISLNKIDKGCLIFCKDEAEGYNIAIIDKIAKNGDRKYWKDSFLHIKSFIGAHHQTSNLIDACKEFIDNELANDTRLSKVDKAMVAVRSIEILKDCDTLNYEQFKEEVFQDKRIASKFEDYVTVQGLVDQIQKNGQISIDKSAIRKTKSKSETIKLDDNFSLSIYGGDDLIVKGYDDNAGMHFYKLYFNTEE